MVSPSLYQKEDESKSLKTLISGEDSNSYPITLFTALYLNTSHN